MAILKETEDKRFVLYTPESSSERKKLEDFPGLLREGSVFFSTAKQNVVNNLVERLQAQKIDIKCTPFVKLLSSDEIELAQLPSTFSYFTKPLPHQDLALRFSYTFSSVGLLLEPGLGKTKVVYDFIWAKRFRKSLVVCPKPLLFVWEVEVLKHRPELKVYVVKTTDWAKEITGINSADVIVINYDKCVAFEVQLSKVNFEFIGIDEGLIKNLNTARTKAIFNVSKNIESRMVMSGTLVNNSPIDVFAPIKFLESSLLGTSITRFKNRFCVPAKFNRNVIIAYRHESEVRSALQACCIVMTKEEWLKDLPAKKFHHLEVTLSDAQRDAYLSLSSNWLATLPGGVEIEVDNPLPLLSKLTQIVNGFLYYGVPTEDENTPGLEVTKKKKGVRKVYEFPENSKIERLLKLVTPGGEVYGRRAIVWFNMSYERELIERAFISASIPYLVVAGGEKDIGGKVKAFNNSREIPFLLCQAKTINYGVTVMGHTLDEEEEEWEESLVPEFTSEVSDEIFFSIGFSLELFLQQQDRIHRIGQTKECNYWILLTNSSVERKVVKRLEEKLVCNKSILLDIATTAKIE